MYKPVVLLLGILAIFVKNSSESGIVNPTCGSGDFNTPCCLQVAQLLAVATAGAKASAESCAAAYASVAAASRTCVAAAAAAAAASHVSVQQSVAFSIRPGSCCEIGGAVSTNVTAYGAAIASAVSEAKAAAEASATAAAVAKAQAQAASEVHAQAIAIINSNPNNPANPSCCAFAEEVYNAALIVGKFVANAQAVANAAIDISTKASGVAGACASAQTAVQASSQSALDARINNCCSDSHLSQCASDCAHAFDVVGDASTQLVRSCSVAYDSIQSAAKDIQTFSISVSLTNTICQDECGSVQLTCSRPGTQCCLPPSQTVCLASQAAAQACMDTVGVAKSVAESVGYAKSAISVIADACVKAAAAGKAASNAILITRVERKACCQVVVTIDGAAATYASAIAGAVAQARAAAEAYALGFSQASATAQALARAKASASSFAAAYYDNQACCRKPCYGGIANYVGNCCNCMSAVADACAFDKSEKVAQAIAQTVAYSSSIAGTTVALKTSDAASVVEVAGVQYSFTLRPECCCSGSQCNSCYACGRQAPAPPAPAPAPAPYPLPIPTLQPQPYQPVPETTRPTTRATRRPKY